MMTAAMRPTQFSALKMLGPLDDEEEHGEHHEGEADVEQVVHGSMKSPLNSEKSDPCGA
jgi:hypothetical protein